MIRVLAVAGALLGLALIANEILENITCDGAPACSKIHLSTMLWGLTMFGLCLLILQKGDVSLSIKEARDTAVVVREIFVRRGRGNDVPGTVVKTEVDHPPEVQTPAHTSSRDD